MSWPASDSTRVLASQKVLISWDLQKTDLLQNNPQVCSALAWLQAQNDHRSGVILETEGSVRKIQKRSLFHYKTVKKGTPNFTSPYVYDLFTIVLRKQIFEKTLKSPRAASGNRTQFKPEINPVGCKIQLTVKHQE